MNRSAWVVTLILVVGAVGWFLFTRQLHAQRAEVEAQRALAEAVLADQERLRKDREVRPPAGRLPPYRSDFAGKYLVISTRQSAGVTSTRPVGFTLENVSMRRLDSQSFLVGAPVKKPLHTRQFETAKVIWVPVDQILAIREFDNLKDVAREEEGRLEEMP